MTAANVNNTLPPTFSGNTYD